MAGSGAPGLFHGVQTNLSYVPEQKTDFIFSAVGEQLGFVGSAIGPGVARPLSWRVLRSAQVARDSFGRLLRAGIFTLLAFSIFENAGMSMGIMPIAGIPLPFFSYGGSAIVAFFAAVGISSRSTSDAGDTGVRRPSRAGRCRAAPEEAAPEEAGPEQFAPEEAVPTPRLDGDAEVWHVVDVEDVELELPGSHPEVVLAEKESPWRRLRIPVGFTEANAIAYALRRDRSGETAHPRSHDGAPGTSQRRGRCTSANGAPQRDLLRRARDDGPGGARGRPLPAFRRDRARTAPAHGGPRRRRELGVRGPRPSPPIDPVTP